MTQIDEPNLDEQIDKALEELVYCGRDTVGVTDEAVLARKAIKALIATQIQEAYKKGYIDGQMKGFDVAFDSHDYDRLRAYRADIAQLRSTQ